MPLEEQKRALSYSPSRSPGSSRLYGSTSQRQQRSSPASRKPPEPLRRAVADCLSSGAPHPHGNPSALSSEAARTLRDYIATPSTTDTTYNVLIDHALAERDRSPAVVPRCVALLKWYLLRYVPRVQTLRQIDLFCVNSIVECESITSRRVSLWSKSLTQHSGTSSVASNAFPPSPASNFGSLVKSLNYVRSLVARHIPKLSFQPLALSGASTSAQQSLPSLSSLLNRSFTSQLSPEVVNTSETSERREAPDISALSVSHVGTDDGRDGNKYMFSDLLKWRWNGGREHQSSSFRRESDDALRHQDARPHGFLEVGAAALLVGDVGAKLKDQPWKDSFSQELPDADRLLQPSNVNVYTNSASAHGHLKTITASKRIKQGPQEAWVNVPAGTFNPQARPLFQYRYYSEQQPLRLNLAEIREVIAEICSESSASNVNLLSAPSPLIKQSEQPATDVAVSVLIKLIIDMYVMDSGTAAPLTLSLIEDMLSSQRVISRNRAFDLILNLGVHAHLLEPILPEVLPMIDEDEGLQEPYLSNAEQTTMLGNINTETSMQQKMSSAIDNFESWLLVILFEILRLLVQTEEQEEIVWASALSCLFYFVCDRGKILRNRMEGLDIRVVKALLEISREHSWAVAVHCKLVSMLTNMFYQSSNGSEKTALDTPTFYVEQVDLLGGIDFICLEYSRANLREEKQNLFLVLFDYVVHQINEACVANGASVFVYEEIQSVASMFTLVDAPEAFYIAAKHGVEGIGQILRISISAALSKLSNYERLDLLVEKITWRIDAAISTFTRLDNEFSYMFQMTKSCNSLESIEDGFEGSDIVMKARLSWATLHSLLHSERSAYRHNGYIWLVELLLSEISEDNSRNIWHNIKKFQQQVAVAGSQQDLTCLALPLPICIMCGLLKSKHNFIRWGFLFVLEKLLMRCKLLLDESELQGISCEDVAGGDCRESRLDKANAIIDIMSCALSLVVQINETDHINILKMCDMLFSQLCLRPHSASGMPDEDIKYLGHQSSYINENIKGNLEANVSQGPLQKKNSDRDDFPRNINKPALISDMPSMAALLLRGHAIVPMQLVAHVPTSLFYWPLIQLAGAATDDIALGVAVGSKGRGNSPGATSDIRAALLLLLIGKCTADSTAFLDIEGEEFFRGLLDDTDSRVAYYSSAFLLKRMMTDKPESYQRILQSLVAKAQECNNEKLLENPYLQMRGILQLLNDAGSQL